MANRIYGYARTFSKEQDIARQIKALRDAGIKEKDIFSDKSEDKDAPKPEYQRLKNQLRAGDTIVIESIDQLGWNYQGIALEWKAITKDYKANIRVLEMSLLDTASKDASLPQGFVADFVLQLLSYVAERQRIRIRRRQAEGIAQAKEQGKVFGRPKIKRPLKFDKTYHQWMNKEISLKKALQILRLKRTTFYKFAQEIRAAQAGADGAEEAAAAEAAQV
ncbi:MAG: recombinase family protein [Peptococcaceae bacterium]|jgi:DNA invertase Pin-like site-specific DNA recombinase|nr:recombinase family protein [Peptococcaceae bacterium]